jgi:hypothetical protein
MAKSKQQIINELRDEIIRLKKALRKYGSHNKCCESHNQDRNTIGMGLTRRECDCGFEQALKEGG